MGIRGRRLTGLRKRAGIMNDRFFELKREKQDRMINGALKVFATQGYRHASTDDIVKEAGISKGLLFHYFGSKQGTYAFVYDYSARFMMLELRDMVDPRERELFGLMKQIERAKLNALKGYPYMQMFLDRANQETSNEALVAIAAKRPLLLEAYELIYEQVNPIRLPEGVELGKLRKMMELTIKGLMSERFRDGSFQPESLCQEIEEYLDMMKGLVYR